MQSPNPKDSQYDLLRKILLNQASGGGGGGSVDPELTQTAAGGASVQRQARQNLGLLYLSVADEVERLALSVDDASARLIYQEDGQSTWALIGADPTNPDHWIRAEGFKQGIFGVEAGAIIPRVTTGAGLNTTETATFDLNYDVIEFDPATQQYAQLWVTMPNDWNRGIFYISGHWGATSGVVGAGIRLGAAARVFNDGDTIDQALSAFAYTDDTFQGTGIYHETPEIPVTTAGTPVADYLSVTPMVVELTRQVAHVGDTLGANLRLKRIQVRYTKS